MSTSQRPNLNTLLQWATENTAPAQSVESPLTQAAPRSKQPQKLDTAMLDVILGRSDAVRMREAMEVFEDSSKPIKEREIAGEELEDLVQNLDNANDLEPLGMWPKLMKALVSLEDRIQYYACWIVGTAIQNNAKSQAAFLKQNPLPCILEMMSSPLNSTSTHAKSVYLLTSTLKHAPWSTFADFVALKGFQTLSQTLRGPSLDARRKAAFLINTLAIQFESIADSHGDSAQAEECQEEHVYRSSFPLSGEEMISTFLNVMESQGIWSTLIQSLSPSQAFPTGVHGDAPSQDDDYNDKALRTIATLLLLPKAASLVSIEIKSKVQSLIVELKTISSEGAWTQTLQGAGIGQQEWDIVQNVLSQP